MGHSMMIPNLVTPVKRLSVGAATLMMAVVIHLGVVHVLEMSLEGIF